MPWDVELTIQSGSRVLLPFVFNAPVLAIDITATNQQPTWYRSGFLRAILNLDGQPFIGANIETQLGQQVINLPFANYQIDFAPRVWLNSATIKIKQLTNNQVLDIMPMYVTNPTSMADRPVLDSVPTTFSAPAYNVATPANTYQCLAANTSRQTFAVTNTGGSPVCLDMDAPASPTKSFATIQPGNTYVCDFPYVGAVFLWSSNATAQSCEVRDLIQ